jgi:hypothetical protein
MKTDLEKDRQSPMIRFIRDYQQQCRNIQRESGRPIEDIVNEQAAKLEQKPFQLPERP